jgi:hypothetical protein
VKGFGLDAPAGPVQRRALLSATLNPYPPHAKTWQPDF